MKVFYYILLGVLLSAPIEAQVSADTVVFKPLFKIGQNYSIFTSQGILYTGYVAEETLEFVTLQNRATREKQEVRKSTIVEARILREAPPLMDVISAKRHPQPRYYLLSENALLFDEQTLYLNSHWLLMEKFDYAFTENVDVCMSTLAFYPYSLGLKTSFQLQKNDYVGGSVFGVGDIVSSTKNESWFLGYGAIARYTKGNENRNVNLSAGMVGINSNFFNFYGSQKFAHFMLLNAGFSTRFRESLAFTSEAWYIPALDVGLGGIALKFISDEYNCWTLGCFAFINGNVDGIKLNVKSLPLPYFGVSRKFD